LESSPLVYKGSVVFGSEDGTVYAVRARDGKTEWTYRARGPVKGAVAARDGYLYFGDYAGEVTAVRARDGRRVWRTSTMGAALKRAGTFYSTPAVGFGRVYLGNTDGKVYSFSARTGKLAWSKSTGGYVYASPALAAVSGTPPSVYIGSYDGRFYALNARSGAIRWSYGAGGRISGAPTVIGRVVYFSELDGTSTHGVDVKDGKRRFFFPAGAYNPAVTDGERLYLTGRKAQYALAPRHRAKR
jgi:outer membrane protein assembly factor BamB